MSAIRERAVPLLVLQVEQELVRNQDAVGSMGTKVKDTHDGIGTKVERERFFQDDV